MAAAEASPPEPSPAKFSRYRSVRQAQAQQAVLHLQQSPAQVQETAPVLPMHPVPPMEPQKDATVSRSMSRYHRRPTTSHAAAARAPPIRSNTTEVPPLPANAQTATSAARNRAVSSPQDFSRLTNHVQPRLPNTSKSRSEAVPTKGEGEGEGVGVQEPSQTARDEAKQLLQAEADRQRRMHEQLKAEKRAEAEAAQAERERAEKLRRDEEEKEKEEEEERVRAQREAEEAEEAEQLRRQKDEQERGKRLQKAESSRRAQQREEEERKARYEETVPPVSPPRHGGAFGLFRRRKDHAPASSSSAANTGKPRQTSNDNRDLDTIRPGGGGAVLGIDAPISAVNAGDRRVAIVCNKSRFLLPVTPTTTPLMLLKSAATCLTEPINVRTAVLLECFQKVGLKRPLRNYEHVRDVMNSWDEDKQNDLLVVDSVSNHIDQQALLASQAPDSKPGGMGCYIHYSSKPGKWSKRYIALRPDGQLVVSKSESSKDQENICHLSDFDMYTPTEKKVQKIKPPRKFCFAVKSQQKSTMFMDETRFVHFFSTDKKDTAALFYKSLHSWRSWYLKNVMGEGQKPKAPEPKASNGYSTSRNVPGSAEQGAGSTSHARNASVGSHYQLGTFSPLLSLDLFSKAKEEAYKPGSFPDDAPLAKLDTRAMHARKMSTRVKAPPPPAYHPNAVTNDTNSQATNGQNSLAHNSPSQAEQDTFAATGLLGRTYSQLQRTVQERDKKPSGPFTEGPSLLNSVNYTVQPSANDSGLGRRSSVRSSHHRTSSDMQRNLSTRVKPKPLVDLTPQYREPPQHVRKGKGFVPEGSSGPLIENATSLEEAIQIPSSTDWRARPTTARPTNGTYGTGGHERTRSLKGRGEGLAAYTVNNHYGAPEDDSNAFTGGGLLARAGFNQGRTPVGHGVMDGSKAKGPMLDLSEDVQFASGSLLATVARVQGPTGLAVDRDKRRSVDLG